MPILLVIFAILVSACTSPGLVRDGKLNAELTRSVVRQTAQTRRLPQKKGLPVELIKPAQAKAELLSQVSSQISDDSLHAYTSLLRKLKLVPADFDANRFLAEKLETGVGGYYDLDSETMRIVHSKSGLGLSYKLMKRVAQRDLGGEFLLAHEVAHALADQHFDLKGFLQPESASTDALLARRAYVEGDAMLTGMWFAMGKTLRPVTYSEPVTEEERGLFDQVEEFFETPPVIRRPMLFLYGDGFVFAHALYTSGGTRALDEVYARPPRSSEEILHPEKYRRQDDPPVNVVLAGVPEIFRGASLVSEDTLGEIGILSMLLEAACRCEASRAAAGWGGDRYRLYRFDGEKDKVGFEWVIVWDSTEDAQEYQEAFVNLLTESQGQPVGPGRWETDKDMLSFIREDRQTTFMLWPRQ